MLAGLRMGAWIAACIGMAPVPASAQAYPAKPIKVIVGFAAGGASDVTARILAPRLAGILGQPVVIENRLGSGGAMATEFVAKSPPDGYAVLLMPAAEAAQPAVRRKLAVRSRA
jgi:tripartite-type tricarboxylate transporter receptor subunit TctC